MAAIIVEALKADYWKPVQAGFSEGTDSLFIQRVVSNKVTIIHPECYLLKMPASPHLAAPAEKKEITMNKIIRHLPNTKNQLVIEGAGGLMAPLNKRELMLNLIKKLKAIVIVVSKNELGSINHSLLTAYALRKEKINVAGWVFNEEYKSYENDIARWSGFPVIAKVKHLPVISKETIKKEARKMRSSLIDIL